MIFLSSVVDPILMSFVVLAICIICVGLLLRKIKQPYIVAYIIAGLLLGSHGLGVVTDDSLIASLGSFGLILLLFFIGMEISLPSLIANWKVSLFGTLAQVLLSIAAVWVIGVFLAWPFYRIIMLGFVISLSSTAVVVKLLQDQNQLNTKIGESVIAILLAQDVFIVPMLIILGYLTGEAPVVVDALLQIVGAVLLAIGMYFLIKSDHIKFPFHQVITNDKELQVFVAFALCFGFAILTAFFGLSAALGSFVAGILVSKSKSTEWVHESLHAFRVVFVALFFVSVGMLIDLHFLRENLLLIVLFVGLVFLTNNAINAGIAKYFGQTWRDAIYAGAILAQIGEFSFILGMTGFSIGLISEFTYQLIVSIISLTLVVSPVWVEFIKVVTKRKF